jgi:hypothetical protein
MGDSADQIEREIEETRERLDENLGELEDRAATNAIRIGRIAAVVLGLAAGGVVGFLVIRRLKRQALKDRLEEMSPDRLRDLVGELASRLRKQAPSVTVTINDKRDAGPGTIQAILRKVAPALVGTASSALIEKAVRSTNDRGSRKVVPSYE